METAKENPKLFNRFIRIRLSVKEHIIKLQNSEERAVETEVEICEQLHSNFYNVFTPKDTVPRVLDRWDK